MPPKTDAVPDRIVTVPSPERRHLTALDGVRGVAVLMVALMHSLEGNFNTGPVMRFVGRFVDSGRLGVDVFFVLSGFLITGILMDTRHDPRYFQRFYARRTLRIFPLYYGLLLLLVLLTPLVHFHWHGMWLWLFLYLQNLMPKSQPLLMLYPGPVGLYHFWTLAVEEQFYLIWPLAVYLLGGRRRTVAWTAVAVSLGILLLRFLLVFTGHGLGYIHISTFTRADQLLMGGCLAAVYRSTLWWSRAMKAGPWLFLVTLIMMMAFTGFLPHGVGIESRYYILVFHYTVFGLTCIGGMIWALTPGTLVQRVMQLPVLRAVGRYSYGFYVLHAPMLTLCMPPLRYWLRDHLNSRELSFLLSGQIVLLVSFGLAWLSFHFYEKRFLALKRLFEYSRVEPARITHEPAAR